MNGAKNTAIYYRYRDGSGRAWGRRPAVFVGAADADVVARIRGSLMDGLYFVPFQVGLDEFFPWGDEYPFEEGTDPPVHELLMVGDCNLPPTEDRTIEDFVEDLEAVSMWDCSPLAPGEYR